MVMAPTGTQYYDYTYGEILVAQVGPFTTMPEGCPVECQCQVLNAPQGAQDWCIYANYNRKTGTYTWDTMDPGTFPPGIYDVKTTCTSGEHGMDMTIITITVEEDPCADATLSFITTPFPEITFYTIGGLPFAYPWNTEDVVQSSVDEDCGPIICELTNSDGSAISEPFIYTQIGTTALFTINENQAVSFGGQEFDFDFTCFFENDPVDSAISITNPLKVVIIEDVCNNGNAVLTPAQQTNPPPANYNGVDTVFNYNPYTISPDNCPITTSCKSVTPSAPGLPCLDIDNTTGTVIWNFDSDDYNSGNVPPGDYTYTYTVSGGPNGPEEEFEVVLTIPDECDASRLVCDEPFQLLTDYNQGDPTFTYSWNNNDLVSIFRPERRML